MAQSGSDTDIVSEFLTQNPHLAHWLASLRSHCETNKQWHARREFILRNMETFPTIQPGIASPSLDRLVSLSMAWSNNVFLGCNYPQAVMDKLKEMADGVKVQEVPAERKANEIHGKGKRTSLSDRETESSAKKPKVVNNAHESRAADASKAAPPRKAPADLQPFFNRLYKTVAWKLVAVGGFGPNLDHYEILQACVESSKASLTCVFVPLKDIPDLPAARSQKEGQVCELRCNTVYVGTGYGRDEVSARAMASKEALKIFQGRKVLVKMCRRRYRGQDMEDLVLVDEQQRNSVFPPSLSCPF